MSVVANFPEAKAALQLHAPISGWLVPLSSVSDQVFSGQLIGDGFAIDPTDSVLRAPFDGWVNTLHESRHAITVKTPSGAEVLMHIGLDTVRLRGQGFTVHVAHNDMVRAGDPLISFDMDAVARHARSMIVPVVLTAGGMLVEPMPAYHRVVKHGDSLCAIHTESAEVISETSADAAVIRKVKIQDPVGMHARPAGLIAQIVKSAADTEVIVRLGYKSASAASPVGLMLLGATYGDELILEGTGPHADHVVSDIADILTGLPDTLRGGVSDSERKIWSEGSVHTIHGTSGFAGIATGISVHLAKNKFDISYAGRDPETERQALQQAWIKCAADLRSEAELSGGKSKDILLAHLSLMEDESLQDAALNEISLGASAAYSWKQVIHHQCIALQAQENPSLRERISDLEDIYFRVLYLLQGSPQPFTGCPENAVLFAEDVLPSQFSECVSRNVRALVLAGAGPTAHISILAASSGIPTVVCAGADALRVPDGQRIIVDGKSGTVHINPSDEDFLRAEKTACYPTIKPVLGRTFLPSHTKDGTEISLRANLSGLRDVASSIQMGAEGCGLLRTEFTFSDRTFAPDITEQRMRYQKIADLLSDGPLTIRLLDVGGDKNLPYIDLPDQQNPALGLRGIRLRALLPDMLRNQIRAILQVKPYHRVRILLPMVASVAELDAIQEMISEEMAAISRSTPIETGVMIEVPSAALIADQLAEKADFLSIGTNDLAQYTLAMDRGNPNLAAEVDAFHPAVLRLIAQSAQGAKKYNRPLSVCGSQASQRLAAPVLIGLGVRELSVPPAAIPGLRAVIPQCADSMCQALAEQAVNAPSGDAVRQLIHDMWPEL